MSNKKQKENTKEKLNVHDTDTSNSKVGKTIYFNIQIHMEDRHVGLTHFQER